MTAESLPQNKPEQEVVVTTHKPHTNFVAAVLILVVSAIFFVLVGLVGHNSQSEVSSNPGFWDPVTATVDWCEENYSQSFYIAEFFNTISNIFYLFYSILGIVVHRNLETRYYVAYLSIAVVGLGSTFFHGTLMFYGQLFDELPMLYLMCTMFYICDGHFNKNSNKNLAVVLFVGATLFSIVYITYPFPTLFQLGWGLFLVYTIYMGSPIYFTVNPKDTLVTRCAMVSMGISISVWIFEQAFCTPLVQLLRLHAIWHLGTAYGVYCIVTSLWFARCERILEYTNVHFSWILFIPVVRYEIY